MYTNFEIFISRGGDWSKKSYFTHLTKIVHNPMHDLYVPIIRIVVVLG
jgi:hypothetical protein